MTAVDLGRAGPNQSRIRHPALLYAGLALFNTVQGSSLGLATAAATAHPSANRAAPGLSHWHPELEASPTRHCDLG